MRQLKLLISVCTMFSMPALAWPWDGAVTGKIEALEVTAAEGFGFLITFMGRPKLCGDASQD